MNEISLMREAFKRIQDNNERANYEDGLLGRINPSGPPTFVPRGMPRHKYVTIRTSSGGQTVVTARDDVGVPESAGLPVRLRKSLVVPNSGVITYVIDRILRDESLATVPPPTGGGVPIHTHDDRYFRESEHVAVSAGADDAGKPIKLNADGEVDASMIDTAGNVAAAVDAATEQTTPGATDKLAAVVSGVLHWISFENVEGEPGPQGETGATGEIGPQGPPGDAADIATEIAGAATDDTIADASIWGYVTSGNLVKTAWSNIKAVLKAYFDTLYMVPSGDYTLTGKIGLRKGLGTQVAKSIPHNTATPAFTVVLGGGSPFAFVLDIYIDVGGVAQLATVNYRVAIAFTTSDIVKITEVRFSITSVALSASINTSTRTVTFSITQINGAAQTNVATVNVVPVGTNANANITVAVVP